MVRPESSQVSSLGLSVALTRLSGKQTDKTKRQTEVREGQEIIVGRAEYLQDFSVSMTVGGLI